MSCPHGNPIGHCDICDEIDAAFEAGRRAALAEQAQPDDGWLQQGGLLYRLTDERCPQNRDEINVTMADGSRTAEARSRRAGELLDRIRNTSPPPRQPEQLTDEEILKAISPSVWMHIEGARREFALHDAHAVIAAYEAKNGITKEELT